MKHFFITVFFLGMLSGCSVKWADHTTDRGFNKETINQYEDAMRLYNKAIFFNKKSVLAYWRRSSLHYRNEDFRKSIEDLNKAIELDSAFNKGYLFGDRGNAKERLGDFQGAVNDYTVAISLCIIEPNRPSTPKENFFHYRAGAYVSLGDTVSAISDLDSAIFYWNEMARAVWLRAKLKTQVKDYIGAMQDYKRMPLGKGQERFDYYADDFYYQGLAKYMTGDSTFCDDWRIAGKYGYESAITNLELKCK